MQYRVIVVAAKQTAGCCSRSPAGSVGGFCYWTHLTPLSEVVESTCNTMADDGFVLINLWQAGGAMYLIFVRP